MTNKMNTTELFLVLYSIIYLFFSEKEWDDTNLISIKSLVN